MGSTGPMKVLVINAGSATLKYQLIDMEREHVLARGLCDKIGADSAITHTTEGHTEKQNIPFPTHTEAFHEICKLLTSGEHAVISSLEEVSAVGHRMVHGGDKFRESTPITEEVLQEMDAIAYMAPLHNPPMIQAVRSCKQVFRDSVPQVAVFDTAFHQSLAPTAYTYPIPYELQEKHGLRRYGFHGTSHRYVSERLAEALGRPLQSLRIVSCHLGSGSSVTAVKDGRSFDTSTGFSTLDGLLMGTRSGSIDPSIVTFLQEKEGLRPEEMDDLLMKRSGLLGVSGLSNDHRELELAAAENPRAKLALDIYSYQIRKYVGAFAAAMGGIDGLIFTGGIGENSAMTRSDVCRDMAYLGIALEEEVNSKTRGTCTEISHPSGPVRVYVIPTNEELLIARDTRDIALRTRR